MSEWIRLDERKPPETGLYLLWLEPLEPGYRASYVIEHWAGEEFGWSGYHCGWLERTHWRRLPDPPREDA